MEPNPTLVPFNVRSAAGKFEGGGWLSTLANSLSLPRFLNDVGTTSRVMTVLFVLPSLQRVSYLNLFNYQAFVGKQNRVFWTTWIDYALRKVGAPWGCDASGRDRTQKFERLLFKRWKRNTKFLVWADVHLGLISLKQETTTLWAPVASISVKKLVGKKANNIIFLADKCFFFYINVACVLNLSSCLDNIRLGMFKESSSFSIIFWFK